MHTKSLWWARSCLDVRTVLATSHHAGAILSIVAGLGTWAFITFTPGVGEVYPAPLCGVLASVLGMVKGSLIPQLIENQQTDESKMYHVHPAHLGQDAPAAQ